MKRIRYWIAYWRWWWSMPMYDQDARAWWHTETELWANRKPKL